MLRRMLLLAAGVIGAALLTGHETPLGAQTPLVRQEIHTLPLNSPTLAALRKAVLAMKALPRTNRRNWFFVANIHGFPSDFSGEPLEPEDQKVPAAERTKFWATCQHASEFFLPWHRAELLTFERMVRELSGDPKFALPYWDAFANPKLPEAFRVATVDGKPNPLRIEERGFGVNDGKTQVGQLPTGLRVADALLAPNYRGPRANGFGGRGKHPTMSGRVKGFVESPPHDHVHGSLGGLMGDPDTAGRDPIFYLHHANIDRLWVVWRQDTKHVNPADTWLKEAVVMPSHQELPEVTFATKELVETVPLGYRYDNEKTASAPAPGPATTAAPAPQLPAAPPVRLRGRGVDAGPSPAGAGAPQDFSRTEEQLSLGVDSVSVELPLPAAAGKRMMAMAAGPQPAGIQQLDVVLRGLTAPTNPGVSYFVYVNLPDKPSATGSASAHFLGLLNSWEVKQAARHAKAENTELRFPIADRLAELLKEKLLDASQLRVAFIRTGLVTSDGTPAPVPSQSFVNVRQIAIEAR
jgi:hypothetical protein